MTTPSLPEPLCIRIPLCNFVSNIIYFDYKILIELVELFTYCICIFFFHLSSLNFNINVMFMYNFLKYIFLG